MFLNYLSTVSTFILIAQGSVADIYNRGVVKCESLSEVWEANRQLKAQFQAQYQAHTTALFVTGGRRIEAGETAAGDPEQFWSTSEGQVNLECRCKLQRCNSGLKGMSCWNSTEYAGFSDMISELCSLVASICTHAILLLSLSKCKIDAKSYATILESYFFW